MDKNELLELLRDNLSLKIERHEVNGNYHWKTGENRLKVSIIFEDIELDYDYIDKSDLEFINKGI